MKLLDLCHLLLFCSLSLHAELIVLTNGKVIDGDIISTNGSVIKVYNNHPDKELEYLFIDTNTLTIVSNYTHPLYTTISGVIPNIYSLFFSDYLVIPITYDYTFKDSHFGIVVKEEYTLNLTNSLFNNFNSLGIKYGIGGIYGSLNVLYSFGWIMPNRTVQSQGFQGSPSTYYYGIYPEIGFLLGWIPNRVWIIFLL